MPTAIQPISRAFKILALLNQRPMTTIGELHHDIALPNATLVRLLHALIADGYVEHVSRTAGYRLGAKLLTLTRVIVRAICWWMWLDP